MNRILSWKIDNGIYAYIYIPNSSTHISSRISEDSPMWSDVLSVISQWDENTYKANFEAMAKEIQQRYGVTLEYKDEYYNFVDGNAIGNTSVVLLAGDDGGGGTLVAGSGGNTGNAQDVYDQFLAAIEAKLAAARAEILAQNNAVREYVEDRVTNTISEAQKMISETKEELDATRGELTSQLEDAKDAIDKAAALFEMGDENITAEDIKNALSSVSEYGGWMEEYSGSLADMKVDYDAADGIIGGIGTGEDAAKGLFSKFATSVNTLSGTVGSVETTLNAATGTIEQVANWYDTYSDEATKAAQYISASGGFIANSVEYINGSGLTSTVDQQIDAKKGIILQEAKAESDAGIATVRSEMSSFSASIVNEISYLAPTSALTSMGEKMNAMSGTVSQWMTKTDSALTVADDIREEWTVESGKLATVSHMIAETGPDGTPIYYVSGETTGEIVVTRKEIIEGDDKKIVYVDASGKQYEEEQVYVHYSDILSSYIQQQASSVTISVMNTDNVTAAIKLALKEDADGEKAVISMVADEVVIDSLMIVRAISAETANIGGIVLEYPGQLYSMAATETDEITYYQLTYAFSSITYGDIIGVDDETGHPIQEATTYYTYNVAPLASKPTDYDSSNHVEENILTTAFTQYKTTDKTLRYLKGTFCEPLFKLNGLDGSITAQKANIRGRIEADEGQIGPLQIGKTGGASVIRDTYGNFSVNQMGRLVAKNADIQGTIRANSGYFKGTISAQTGYIGETLLSNGSLISQKTGEDGQPMYSIDGSTGKISAKDVELRGSISATSGVIGGFELSDGILEAKDRGGKTVAFINGTDEYSDEENGKLLIAAGISGGSPTTASTRIYDNGLIATNNARIVGDLYALEGKLGPLYANRYSGMGVFMDEGQGVPSFMAFRLSDDGIGLRFSGTSDAMRDIMEFSVGCDYLTGSAAFTDENGERFQSTSISYQPGIYIRLRIEQNDRSSRYYGNSAALTIDASQSTREDEKGNHTYAIKIVDGCIAGLRPACRTISASTELTKYDHTILVDHTEGGDITLHLPDNPIIGQEFLLLCVRGDTLGDNKLILSSNSLNIHSPMQQLWNQNSVSTDLYGSYFIVYLHDKAGGSKWWFYKNII